MPPQSRWAAVLLGALAAAMAHGGAAAAAQLDGRATEVDQSRSDSRAEGTAAAQRGARSRGAVDGAEATGEAAAAGGYAAVATRANGARPIISSRDAGSGAGTHTARSTFTFNFNPTLASAWEKADKRTEMRTIRPISSKRSARFGDSKSWISLRSANLQRMTSTGTSKPRRTILLQSESNQPCCSTKKGFACFQSIHAFTLCIGAKLKLISLVSCGTLHDIQTSLEEGAGRSFW